MSFYDRFAVPEILLRADTKAAESHDNAREFEDDIIALRSFQFVSTTTDERTWVMHRLVQDATQLWLDKHGELSAVLDRFVHQLDQCVQVGAFHRWHQCRILFPHVKRAVEQRPTSDDVLLEWASVMYKSAWYAEAQGKYSDAFGMAKMANNVDVEQLGPDHLETLISLAIIASTYRNQGRWTEAEELQSELVEATQRLLGLEHPSTLTSIINLASTYCDQGRWKEAEELQIEVLETTRRMLGLEHPNTLTSMNNLALTYWGQGQLD